MIIRIFSIGKIKHTFIKQGEAEYLKRLSNSALKIKLIELEAEHFTGKNQASGTKKEAERLLEYLDKSDFLVLLDENGKNYSSEAFSEMLAVQMNSGIKSINFAIGGAFGWHESILKRAQIKFSLSALTFPYQIAHLLLIEQLYRGYTIIQGAPYHKE